MIDIVERLREVQQTIAMAASYARFVHDLARMSDLWFDKADPDLVLRTLRDLRNEARALENKP